MEKAYNEMVSEFLLSVSRAIKNKEVPFAILTVNEDTTVNFAVSPSIDDEDLLGILEQLIQTTKDKIATKLN